MGETTIEWTDAVWNCVTGCEKISPGCKHCYAERVFPRAYSKQTVAYQLNQHLAHRPRKFTDVLTHPDRLEQPLHWKKPRRIFVNSMSDLFHEDVPPSFVKAVFDIMKTANHHTYQILTKRPERMKHLVTAWLEFHGRPIDDISNVWLGVSVENQQYADQRIPLLLQTPAAVRFVSYEPALGPVDFNTVPSDPLLDHAWIRLGCPTLDWVIVGGESGPGARPFNIQWARDVIQQCRAAGVSCFVKQLGQYPHEIAFPRDVTKNEERKWQRDGWTLIVMDEAPGSHWRKYYRLKDRKGGTMEEWPEDLRVREFPASRGGL